MSAHYAFSVARMGWTHCWHPAPRTILINSNDKYECTPLPISGRMGDGVMTAPVTCYSDWWMMGACLIPIWSDNECWEPVFSVAMLRDPHQVILWWVTMKDERGCVSWCDMKSKYQSLILIAGDRIEDWYRSRSKEQWLVTCCWCGWWYHGVVLIMWY